MRGWSTNRSEETLGGGEFRLRSGAVVGRRIVSGIVTSRGQ